MWAGGSGGQGMGTDQKTGSGRQGKGKSREPEPDVGDSAADGAALLPGASVRQCRGHPGHAVRPPGPGRTQVSTSAYFYHKDVGVLENW